MLHVVMCEQLLIACYKTYHAVFKDKPTHDDSRITGSMLGTSFTNVD